MIIPKNSFIFSKFQYLKKKLLKIFLGAQIELLKILIKELHRIRIRRRSSDIVSSYFFRPSRIWSMLHYGSVGASLK